MKVEFNQKQSNPFYGLRNCLNIFSQSESISYSLLNQAYAEVAKDKEKREMYFSLLFSIGDITGRQHNIFKGKKKDSGGNAQRDDFYLIVTWMIENHFEQFKLFLESGLFNEYTCFDVLLRSRVQTKGAKLLRVYDRFNISEEYNTCLVNYLAAIIRGTNEFNKTLVAKFLTLPRLSVRSKHNKMLPETEQIMKNRVKFLKALCDELNWKYIVSGNYLNFFDYRNWRALYNRELESVLFSTKSIQNLTQDQFINWLNKIPASARFRVKNRVMYANSETGEYKYPDLKKWYETWENFKIQKQKEQRVLEEEVRQGNATIEDIEKLKKVKKESKVTVGATNFKQLYQEIVTNNIDILKLEAFMNKVNLPYNSLTIIDDSGSMQGAPYRFASFMAAACLVKNPDDVARNLLGFFNNNSRLYSYISVKSKGASNSILCNGNTQKVNQPFVDPTKSFYDNYKNINAFCKGVFQSGGTNISSIPIGFYQQAVNNSELIDELKNYPVWTIISDTEWNNLRSPEASLNDFFKKCEMYFGYKPFIIAIDAAISNASSFKAERFSGIENFIYIPANLAQIEQVLTNFKDIDCFDVYTPLLSLYRSNRYELVRMKTL